MNVTVVKADGTSEHFNPEKLRRSLRRAGANPSECASILLEVEGRLHEGIRTQEIYRVAFELLRQHGASAATRYSLRRALFGLGPTGFPFELFLARLFTAMGYTASNGNVIQGHCATHEIDIACYKEGHSFIGEAKFHARPGTKTDLQVAMYSYARLLDLRDQKICFGDNCGIKEFWLVTNTKFTSAAEAYAECVGIKLLSWDYPKHDNLHDRLQRFRLYPITVLSTLTHQQMLTLINQNIITCKDLLDNPKRLNQLHVTALAKEKILQEATSLSQNKDLTS